MTRNPAVARWVAISHTSSVAQARLDGMTTGSSIGSWASGANGYCIDEFKSDNFDALEAGFLRRRKHRLQQHRRSTNAELWSATAWRGDLGQRLEGGGQVRL